MNRALNEIMRTSLWDFHPESLQAYRKTLLDNFASRLPFIPSEEREDRPFFLSSSKGKTERTYVGNPEYMNFDRMEPEDTAIGVIRIEGPVLRNGGACAYGSKEHRDIIMRASDDPHVQGFLMWVDSPGGSSFSKYDYEKALVYARSKGKKLIGLADGMACSAGYAVLAMCDEIYFTDPHDEVGCIGSLWATYMQKHEDVNAVTQEKYVEIYADDSPYKNEEYRDAAEGNYDKMRETVNRSAQDFRQMVKKYRPKATEEQLSGRTYEAGEVIGTLTDGQSDFGACIARIQQLAGKPAQAGNSQKKETAEAEYDNQNQSKTKTSMEKKTYPLIQSAAGVEALVVEDNGGFYMVETMADNVESFIAKAKQNESTLAAKLAETAQLNETVRKMKEEHESALAALKSDHEASLKQAEEKAKEETGKMGARIAELEKQIEEKDAEIKTLSEAASQAPAPQDPPKENASGSGQEYKGFKSEPVSKEGMSWEEKAEAAKEREKTLARQRRK